MNMSATYSPDDNKLRMTASARLDADLYARVKAAGFRWAPRQEIFVCPRWTPAAEDLCIELCGEIDDEDTTLAERAEDRAERFENYSEKRHAEANRAHQAVAAIADNIPLGQPILIGHHSEKRARRDAEKIGQGMDRAVKLFDTAKYWTSRAAGAIANAKYKELPAVRARRIKGIEADLRKVERSKEGNQTGLKAWSFAPMSIALATRIANTMHASHCFTLAEFPRVPPLSQYEGHMSFYSALTDGICTPEQAQAILLPRLRNYMANCERWIAHYNNRLAYERAMLGESGYVAPPKPSTKAVLPLLNYAGEVETLKMYDRGTEKFIAHPMTKAEFAKVYKDYKGTRVSADGTHRVRSVCTRLPGEAGASLRVVYLTDSKLHTRPGVGPIETTEQEQTAARINRAQDTIQKSAAARVAAKASNAAAAAARATVKPTAPAPAADDAPFDAMRATLKAGVKVVSAPQLFPTPAALAERMVEIADIEPGHRVLEPSAGTGALLAVMPNVRPNGYVVAVEINHQLADMLRETADETHAANFLEMGAELGKFDRIVMNPPFAQSADIVHIKHALTMLAPGGRLVALCANGPRQRAALEPLAEEWEDLPPGSFAAAGTNVNVAMLTFQRAA